MRRKFFVTLILAVGLQACQSSEPDNSADTKTSTKPSDFNPGGPTILEASFNTISMWPDNTLGTAHSPSTVTTGDSNHPSAVQFKTGADLGDLSGAQSYSKAVPTSFSVTIVNKLVSVGSHAKDGLQLQIHNSQNKTLQVSMTTTGFYLYQDNHWQKLSNVGGLSFTKWFLEITDLGHGAHRVDLFVNDTYATSRSGVLPNGKNNGGYVAFSLANQRATNQTAWVSQLKIGRVGVDLISSLFHNSLPMQVSVNSLTDAFSNPSGIDQKASTNAYWDPRSVFQPLRSQSTTFLDKVFENLNHWTLDQGGSGVAPFISGTGSNDPAVASVVVLNPGSDAGAFAKISTVASSIPNSYGISILQQPSSSSDISDGLVLSVQNIQNKDFQAKFCTAGVYVYVDGAWTVLQHHGGNYFTEWWFQLTDAGNGSHQIDLYAGTRLAKSITGTLPNGTGRDGQVSLISKNGQSTGQLAIVSALQIGLSALPTPTKLVSNPHRVENTVHWGKITVLIEDVSLGLLPNSNVTASISADGGQTWDLITLVDQGVFGPGRLDDTKPIRILSGERQLSTSGTNMVYQINTGSGVLNVISGVSMEWH